MKNKGIFLAYSSLASRSKRIAEILSIKVFFVRDKFPYIFSIFFSLIKILKEKPKFIFLQLTQGPILFLFFILKKLLKFKLVADMHTGFLIYLDYKGIFLNKPFVKFLKFADLIILHNEKIKEIIPKEIKEKILVIYDPEIKEKIEKIKIKSKKLLVFVPISLKKEEPLNIIIKAAEELKKEALFISTGIKKVNLKNIKYLGYLPYDLYLKILKSSDLVLALTKREYTLLSVLFESILLEKCIISSKTKTITDFLKNKATIIPNDYKSLINSIRKLKKIEERKKIEKEISLLKKEILENQKEKIKMLTKILE